PCAPRAADRLPSRSTRTAADRFDALCGYPTARSAPTLLTDPVPISVRTSDRRLAPVPRRASAIPRLSRALVAIAIALIAVRPEPVSSRQGRERPPIDAAALFDRAC